MNPRYTKDQSMEALIFGHTYQILNDQGKFDLISALLTKVQEQKAELAKANGKTKARKGNK